MPEGIVCRTYFSRPTTTVWPALLPPEKRTTTFTCGVMMSTTLPLPSSPHCAPTTTMLGMAAPLCFVKVPFRMLEHVAHAERALPAPGQVQCQQLPRAGAPLPAPGQVQCQQLPRAGARAANHEDVPHALGAGVGQ